MLKEGKTLGCERFREGITEISAQAAERTSTNVGAVEMWDFNGARSAGLQRSLCGLRRGGFVGADIERVLVREIRSFEKKDDNFKIKALSNKEQIYSACTVWSVNVIWCEL